MTSVQLELVMNGSCPDSFYCKDGSHGYNAIRADLYLIPPYATIVSAVFSVLGAATILVAYFSFKDLRRGTAQTIITLLALADLGAAFGSLLGIGNFLTYYHLPMNRTNLEQSDACWIFHNICQLQAFVVFWCAICSYIWSAVLAVHFLLATILHHSKWTDRLMPLYNIVAWTLPIIVLLPLLITGKLGYTPTYQVSCYLAVGSERNAFRKAMEITALWIEVVICGVITVISYTIIAVYLYRKVC